MVTVEKDFEKKALRFRVNGTDPNDQNGKPYGWQNTELTAEKFASLVGVVEMMWKDDELKLNLKLEIL